MVNSSFTKALRLKNLCSYIKENPFVTDEELARIFNVSVQTIRLDRVELGIPEMRQRTKKYAEHFYSQVKSLTGQEIVGDLLEFELERGGVTVLEITNEMVFQKNGIARGHILFSQANSLAVALVDADVALTGVAKVSFVRPVRMGEKIKAKAIINSKIGNKYNISVTSRSEQEVILQGEFRVFAVDRKEGLIIEDRS